MKEKTKAYMAGLMDAEGCFTIIRGNRPWGFNYMHRVSLVNTYMPLRKWIIKHFGGSARVRRQQEFKPRFDWTPQSHKHAQFFISCIQPYLRIKLEESKVLQEFYSLDGEKSPSKREALWLKVTGYKNRGSVTTELPRFEKNSYDNAYFAGFFDGEGCISGDKKHSLRLALVNTDKRILEYFKSRYGGNIRQFVRHDGWSACWIWELGDMRQIESILLQLLPYLIVKREQAKVALNICRLWHKRDNLERLELFSKLKSLKQDTV
jgi:LAGLIDADG-like domain